MKTIILSSVALFLAFAWAPASAQDAASEPPDVETLMTPEDFEASGLGKLNDAERAHLSQWLERYREGALVGPEVNRPPSEWTEEEKKAERSFQIVAKVVPSFRGWSGKTTFRLDNGQVWQQRMRDRLRYTGANSEIVITKNALGGYVLEHPETGRSVLVKRID